MRATPIYPIEAMHGGLTDNYYCRMVGGRLIVQHKPRRNKPPTEKQLMVRKAFAEKQKQRRISSGEGPSGIVVVS